MVDDPSTKRDEILRAALGVFGRYGYRRTSMDLLAQAAGMSRPALYQHFTGKADIFRAVGAYLVDELSTAAENAREAEGATADRLFGVLSVKLELAAGTVEANARRDLIAEAGELASDLQASLRDRLITVVEALLDSVAEELDQLSGSASSHDVATLLVDALTGIAQEPEPLDVLQARLRQLVDLAVRGLSGHKTRLPLEK